MNIYEIQDAENAPRRHIKTDACYQINKPCKNYTMARPLGVTLIQRMKAAWLVLNNQACAVRWY